MEADLGLAVAADSAPSASAAALDEVRRAASTPRAWCPSFSWEDFAPRPPLPPPAPAAPPPPVEERVAENGTPPPRPVALDLNAEPEPEAPAPAPASPERVRS